ncbi:MAG TPA: ATP-binding cassette domain-containing protein, partial [Iamia sp.]|nr:ATP-binding cassette domain-containing protein [Iamia sp.]
MEPIIQLRGVTKSFGSHTVLEDISFDIPRNKISAIMGPSGTGKTTLLRLITGQVHAQRGDITAFGENIATLSHCDLFALRRRMG